MAMELSISQKQSQVMIMTPQLQQAIKLLQLNQVELTEEINQEMMENPILELTPPADSAEAAAEASLSDPLYDQTPEATTPTLDQFAEVAGEREEKIREEFDWENYLGEYSSSPSTSLGMGSMENPEETPSFETFMASKTSLTEHLTWQWRFVALDLNDFRIGETIIGNLNEDGYLAASIEEIAQMTGSTPSQCEDTLSRIQELDPAGIAARDLSECLQLQLNRLGLGDSIASTICRRHLKLLEKKDLLGLCKALQCEKDLVTAAIDSLRSLDPKPGRAYANNDPIYVTPDVYITKVGDDYVISLNEDGLPKLRFNKAYRRMLNDKSAPEETRKYLNEKLKGAAFLIRSIHQRQKTIFRVTECIFTFQRDFLDKGVEYLKPLVLRDVADVLGFHESTISRVTTNKYVDTPRGVFELKYFFDSPISRFQGDSLSSESVKNRIKQIISGEDPKKPLSDQRIVEILHGSNINIARRTVAKYREILGVGSSAERRQMY
ncbi:MAG: RNA polymerase factor sigma-54 [Deltaproteobacteria bacterium]|jgi:RNA polymerase sigma-54 factor|nr:RNA polymerase factor sigma-54 [Deltaproteobacteria bacterium]